MDDRQEFESAIAPGSDTRPASEAPYAVEPAAHAPASEPGPVSVRTRRTGSGFGRLLMAALIGGVVGAAALYLGLLAIDRGAVPGLTSPSSSVLSTIAPVPAQPIEAVAARIVPSVVNIAIEQQDAFGTSSGVGSGVIIRSDGYILTNNHVVEGATRLVVRLGTVDLVARVVGADPGSDLAVLKIDRTGLPAATLGSSAGLQVGEGVVAVGSPFGLDKTVTSGIVSALHRTNLTQGQSGVTAYTNLIQTDAPINPGNSGGALTDLTGAVVGINTLIYSPTGQLGSSQSAGIGFAIPIDFAKTIADQLIAGKKITHPYLGLSTATVNEAFAQYYGLPVSSGALVQQVSPGSPAAAAGIRVGDIIVRVGDQAVATSEDVLVAVRAGRIGQSVQIESVRGDKHVTVEATLTSDAGAQ